MKHKLLIALLLFSVYGYSQYEINDGKIEFCPTTPGDLIQIDFTSFNTEEQGVGTCYDYLGFWQGNVANPTLGTEDNLFCGPLGPFSLISTSPDGCISFTFHSDNTVTRAVWEATISCITPYSPPTAGPTTTHTYPSDDKIYVASVSVRDDNTAQDPLKCQSTNSVTRIIRVNSIKFLL